MRAFNTLFCVVFIVKFVEEAVSMCILFVYINNDAVDEDEYKVIIALNRDEFIDRPTLPAQLWNGHCISG